EPKPKVITQQRATCVDPGVPRFRPHVVMAESQLDQGSMQERAQWLARYSAGKAREATVQLRGFRQADGTRWVQNTMVTLTAAWLGFDEDLLIAAVEMKIDENGKSTQLLLGPPDAFAPDPGEVKRHKAKGKKAKGKGGINLSTMGSVPNG
ncbi:MAG: phage baseplate assembly protein, partial [Janthinobacterium lividum]